MQNGFHPIGERLLKKCLVLKGFMSMFGIVGDYATRLKTCSGSINAAKILCLIYVSRRQLLAQQPQYVVFFLILTAIYSAS